MKQLIYCSKAKNDLTFEEIKNILDTANNKNKKFNLTGMLIYNGIYFLQCIEGETKNIDSLYLNIQKDNRHFDINLIDYIDISKRDFIHWSMGYYFSKKQINDLIQEDNFEPYNLTFDEAKHILKHFSKGL